MIRLAIISTGRIYPRILNGARLEHNIEVIAMVSRSKDKATELANLNHIPYGMTIDEALTSELVDAVYIATINQSHYDIIKKALMNHKHVMCEKPMVPTSQQVNELFDLAKQNHVMLMEAMKALFIPMTQKIKSMIDEGQLGRIIYMDGKYGSKHNGYRPDFWLYDKEYGGSLKDVGVYPLGYFNYLIGSDYKKIDKTQVLADKGYDLSCQVNIVYKNDALATLFSSFQLKTINKAYIYGEKGYLEIENFWKCDHAYWHHDNTVEEISAEMISDFYYEIHHFVECISAGCSESPIMSRKASLACTAVYEARIPLL